MGKGALFTQPASLVTPSRDTGEFLEPVPLENIYTAIRIPIVPPEDGFSVAVVLQIEVNAGAEIDLTVSLPPGYYCVGRKGIGYLFNRTTQQEGYNEDFQYALCIDTTDLAQAVLPMHRLLKTEEVYFTHLLKRSYTFFHIENDSATNFILTFYAYVELIRDSLWEQISGPLYRRRWLALFHPESLEASSYPLSLEDRDSRPIVVESKPPDPLPPIYGDPYYCPKCHLSLWIEGNHRTLRDDPQKAPYYGGYSGHGCPLMKGLSEEELDALVEKGVLQKK
jgi:hypothetical protein